MSGAHFDSGEVGDGFVPDPGDAAALDEDLPSRLFEGTKCGLRAVSNEKNPPETVRIPGGVDLTVSRVEFGALRAQLEGAADFVMEFRGRYDSETPTSGRQFPTEIGVLEVPETVSRVETPDLLKSLTTDQKGECPQGKGGNHALDPLTVAEAVARECVARRCHRRQAAVSVQGIV